MEEYITTVVLLAIMVAGVMVIAPTADRLRKGMQSALALLLLFAVFSPLYGVDMKTLWDDMTPEIENSKPFLQGEALVTTQFQNGYEAGIYRDLSERYGLQESRLQVHLHSDRTPEGITLMLCGGDRTADAVGMVRYLQATYGIPCEVIYE